MTDEEKRGAVAALELLEAVLRLDGRLSALTGREIYGDGLQDAAIRAANLRSMIQSERFTVHGPNADTVLRVVLRVERELTVEALVPVAPPGVMP